MAVANVDIATATFKDYFDKVNEVATYVSNNIVTANSTLATTTGNARVFGIFFANTLVAEDALRGGNNTTSNTLNITSRVGVSNTVNVATLNANVQINTAAFNVSTTANLVGLVAVNTSLVDVTGNLALSGANSTVNNVKIGYRNIPQRVKNTDYTLAANDVAHHVYGTNTSGTWTLTVANNATVNIPLHEAIMIINAGNTMYLANAAGVEFRLGGQSTTTGSTRTISNNAIVTLIQTETNIWYISGAGVL